MNFIGIPSPEVLHKQSLLTDSEALCEGLTFQDYVLNCLARFSGLNAVPRMVCNVVTREYMTFSMRKDAGDRTEQIHQVAKEFKVKGFYVEVDDGMTARVTMTVSLLICWDPAVLQNGYAQRTLAKEEHFQFYLTVMQYVRAEKALGGIYSTPKERMRVGEQWTHQWASISILSVDMYREAIPVCEVLWNLGYYTGVVANSRRSETWTLFVCWDPDVLMNRPTHDMLFTLDGNPPESWT